MYFFWSCFVVLFIKIELIFIIKRNDTAGIRNTNFLEKSFYEFKNYYWICNANLVWRMHKPQGLVWILRIHMIPLGFEPRTPAFLRSSMKNYVLTNIALIRAVLYPG